MSRVSVRGWLILPLLAVAIYVIPWPVWVIERWYSRDVFPIIQAQVTSLSNLTSIAFIDVGLVLLAAFLVGVLIRIARSASKYGLLEALWEGVRRVVRVAGLLVLMFVVFWGLNYRREPLESTLGGGDVGGPPASAVLALAREAARSAGPVRGTAVRASSRYEDIADRLEPPFQNALQRLGLPRLRVAGRPKVSRVLTPFFTAAGVNGMLNPIALESIVHPDLLPFERPMLLAHEWAHLAGFADEADASALAWLACVTGDAGLQYSAHAFVVLEAAGALPRDDWQAIRKQLAPGVLLDFEALAARLKRQQPVVRENAMRVYDSYLRTNRVDDGVRSYSRVLRVLLTPGMRAAVAPTPRR